MIVSILCIEKIVVGNNYKNSSQERMKQIIFSHSIHNRKNLYVLKCMKIKFFENVFSHENILLIVISEFTRVQYTFH